MRNRLWTKVAVCAACWVMAVPAADAQSRRRDRERERPAPATPGDKRDRVVALPGSPFHGRPFWLALSQCGGIYFKLNTLYSDAAIQTKVVKPDAAASARFTKQADEVSKTATAFFVGAERFLVADRSLAPDEAILTFDPRANESGERLKSIDAALQAAKSCPALYKACHAEFPKACAEPTVPTASARTRRSGA